jgi:hypothetical protein
MGIIGGYQKVPKVDRALLQEERDQFVRYLGASVGNCTLGPADYNDLSFASADYPHLLHGSLDREK